MSMVYRNRKEIIKLYKSGLSYQKIADKFNVSIFPIATIIRKCGIQRNLSESHKGQVAWNKGRKGLIPWNKGKKGSQVAWNKGILKNGGGRQNLFYKDFRREVLIRDRFTCQRCYEKETSIVVHHIKDFNKYPNLRFDAINGQTLCRACHCKIHKPDLIEARKP